MKNAEGYLKQERSRGLVYEFAGLRLDPARRTLELDGRQLALTPRAFDALLLLVEHRDELLTKETLLQRLWPNSVVEENSLARVVSDLRKALGAAAPIIVTVARRGYRLQTDVRALGRHSAAARTTASVRKSIAVLPFSTSSQAESDRFLAFGIADAVIGEISRSEGVIVRPTSSVASYSQASPTTGEVARALDVEWVVRGVMRRSGDQLRVSVQLIDARDETVLWAQRFDERVTDLLRLEDTIAARIGEALPLQLARGGTAAPRLDTASMQAYELYLQGRFWVSQRVGTALRTAAECFTSAVQIDPRFARAYAALAENYVLLSIASATLDGDPPREVVPRARAAAEKALSIDDQLSEAHAALGHIAICFDWSWSDAEDSFRRAIGLKPNNALAHHWYALGLDSVGQPEAALRELEIARELEPTSLTVRVNVGYILYRQRRIEEAIKELRACVELEPSSAYARYRYGLALEEGGRYADAEAQFDAMLTLPAAEVQGLVGKAHLLAVTGRAVDAREILARLLELSGERYVSAYYIAEVFAGLGEKSQAIDWLEKAYEERPVMMISLQLNPKFDELRREPGFVSLSRRVDLWS